MVIVSFIVIEILGVIGQRYASFLYRSLFGQNRFDGQQTQIENFGTFFDIFLDTLIIIRLYSPDNIAL
jgi:hypothetical protein